MCKRISFSFCSNNTNKLSPQEPDEQIENILGVQIIQINLVLKNASFFVSMLACVQIIQINLVLKNMSFMYILVISVQIIQINLVLKNNYVGIKKGSEFK